MQVIIGASIREIVMKGHTRDRFKKIDHSIPHWQVLFPSKYYQNTICEGLGSISNSARKKNATLDCFLKNSLVSDSSYHQVGVSYFPILLLILLCWCSIFPLHIVNRFFLIFKNLWKIQLHLSQPFLLPFPFFLPPKFSLFFLNHCCYIYI